MTEKSSKNSKCITIILINWSTFLSYTNPLFLEDIVKVYMISSLLLLKKLIEFKFFLIEKGKTLLSMKGKDKWFLFNYEFATILNPDFKVL